MTRRMRRRRQACRRMARKLVGGSFGASVAGCLSRSWKKLQVSHQTVRSAAISTSIASRITVMPSAVISPWLSPAAMKAADQPRAG
ncbi:hypothetical protein DA075_22300 [Methylobacterium currus]|uniref:Uncharacterized protein n=1 Tax=Methylobacterium currus TaxID=2051553 RepID=A0A2R4WP02_9HYPH|nr:hypothetical protein DA075_22300 [Methylobacterium currus]